jgi:valyl-tRNA synthetase
VWYKDGAQKVSHTSPGEGWIQDEDTLDTWFSSGLWTFSTLGWPEKTKDLETYHPTSVLETGYDIIFFWVARMILMSEYLLGTKPFKTVYLHGLVRDGQGRKMSKSLGNIIDPLDMSTKYGTDAVRMSIIVVTVPGNDTKMSEDKIRAYKNFANKLWNITRFVLSSTEGEVLEPGFKAFSTDDAKLITERDAIITEITKEMDEYKYYLVAEKLYAYTWKEFADIILENSKEIIANGTEADKKSRKQFLLHTLVVILKTLHPFVPFVTEEIWKDMPLADKKYLIIETWPQ